MTDGDNQGNRSRKGMLSDKINDGSMISNRRNALKICGAGALALLAGCTGNGGGNGNGNGGGNGDGNGGGNGDGNGGGELTQVQYAQPPWGPWVLLNAVAEEEGIWEEEFSEAGYEIEVQETWEDANLFQAGHVDWAPLGSVGTAQMVEENEMQVTVFGEQAYAPHGYFVGKGGPYDPAETGSVQASLDKIVDDQAKFAIGSWAAGSLAYGEFAIEDQFGYTLAEGGDFNALVADYASHPALFERDEIEVFSNSPVHGASTLIMNDEITPLWMDMNLWNENYDALPPLNNMVATTSFAEENRDALSAMIGVYNRATETIANNIDTYASSDVVLDSLPVDNEEEAAFTLREIYEGDEIYTQPVIRRKADFTEEVQEANTSFMNRMAEETDMFSSSWSDRMTYTQVEP